MTKFVILILSVVGLFSFVFGLMYTIGAIRTKDKPPAYIGVGLLCISIVCLYFLAFK